MKLLWLVAGAGWALALAAIVLLSQNEKRHLEAQAILWNQIERYERIVNPERPFEFVTS